MSPPEEQRFEFEEAPARPAARETPKAGSRGGLSVSPSEEAEPSGSTGEGGPDEVADRLKERIERLRKRANEEGASPRRRPRATSKIATADLAEDGRTPETGEAETSEPVSLSIAEFYARVKGALSDQFPGEFWVSGEIRSLRVSNGHRFIELADQGVEGKATQQLEVACWATQWRGVEASLRAADVELEVGRVIRVLGKVSVWEAAGRIRFTLTRIDVEALLGNIAAARQRLLNALELEGLLTRNAELEMPPVPLRIGLVTSQGSEAQKDFLGQLERSRFAFAVELAHTLVQGADAPTQIVEALNKLLSFAPDLCVVVRGGGSRNDLAAFDSEIVARAIANYPVPVWVGVGHTGDHSIADVVASASFITPTACGEAVVARVASYWNAVLESVAHISGTARTRLLGAGQQMAERRAHIGRSANALLARSEAARIDRRARVISATSHLVRAQRTQLSQRAVLLERGVRSTEERHAGAVRQRSELLRAFSPELQLARGWSILRNGSGSVLRSVDRVALGEQVTARLSDGQINVTVDAIDRADSDVTPGRG